MSIETVRNNLMVITSMGFAMFSLGLVLYTKSAWVAPYIRYLLPLPPIAVAAYIYVLNIVKMNNHHPINIAHDLLWQTLISGASFILIVSMLLAQYYFISVVMKK